MIFDNNLTAILKNVYLMQNDHAFFLFPIMKHNGMSTIMLRSRQMVKIENNTIKI